MEFYDLPDKNAKQTYLSMLIKMEAADNKTHPYEERFISDMASKIGLNEEDIEEIRQNPNGYMKTLPNNLADSMRILYYLLFMMGIDGQIDEQEKALCKELGFKLCIRPALIDELIEIMIENLNKKIPEDIMLETVKKYLN